MSIAVVKNVSEDALVLTLDPAQAATCRAGRFLLARCAEVEDDTRGWEIFLRRPLFPTQFHSTADGALVTFALPLGVDAGYRWLRDAQPGESIDLLGPFGVGFDVAQTSRTLLLAATLSSAPLLLPLAELMLDRGGRVTMLLRVESEQVGAAQTMLAGLPFAVEAHVEVGDRFLAAFGDLLPWADQCALAFPLGDYAQLSTRVRARRMRPLPRYAQALVSADLACGVGACLACITPLARGSFTRACVHGPVFDLLEIA